MHNSLDSSMHSLHVEDLTVILSLLLSVLLPMAAGTAVDKPATPKATPLMRTVEPSPAKVGEVVIVKGDHLDKEYVSAVYITDGKKDRQVTLETQTTESLSFKVPVELKPGMYKVIVLLNIAEPTLIEEPVRLNVSE